ncbi:DUF2921 family protein [Senna tora]|uniref:RING-type E3 ubiquitin transferase n=1 Tax=Senna tora TaxID=362788 RepID=A0A834SFK3_9FABA|nr:DUF2921 family protein [Senna tora]
MESPSPLQRSGVSLLSPVFLVNPSKVPSNFLLIFFLLSFLCNFCSVTSSDSNFETTYTRVCNNFVAIPSETQPQTSRDPGIGQSLQFRLGYFSGGDRLFNKTSHSAVKHLLFLVHSIRKTLNDGVFEVRAQLRLSNREKQLVQGNFLRLQGEVYRYPRITHWRRGISFELHGFWSESSGKLCMVGKNSNGEVRKGILKLNYPKDSSIFNSLINGSLESFDGQSSLIYFEPISILALSQSPNYNYSISGTDDDNGCLAIPGSESLSLNNFSQGACSVFNRHTHIFELKYGNYCHSTSCNPLGADAGNLPESMYLYSTRCAERQKVQILLGFPDPSYHDSVFPFYPNTTLISEGTWDEKENQLCAVACRILNFSESLTDAYIGDCSTKLTLRFPATLSLRNRSTVLGQIWSNKAVDESGRPGEIRFQGYLKVPRLPHGFQYKYTEIDTVRKSCAQKMTARGKGKMYPDGNSSDMRFDMLVRNSKGQVAQGYSSPLFVGDQIYDSRFYGESILFMENLTVKRAQLDNQNNLLNVSYSMSFKPSTDFKFDGEGASAREVVISAEGMYNRNAGLLCMIGCRHLRPTDKQLKNESLDCELLVNVQFPPLDAKGSQSVTGTIESKREKSDPYYFEPLKLSSSSIYLHQAEASIWRMDIEIIMLLISNTLACVFVGFQLLYVKRHPDALPYISIVMLIVLTLGHMIPLLLNFEALFLENHRQQSVFLGSGDWLKLHEVVVRMVTMVAFLLELRLLQLTWSSRQGEGSQPGLWVSERNVIFVTLPLYLIGGLTTWWVHIWKNSQQKTIRPFRLSRHRYSRGRLSFSPPSLWGDLKSFAGLILDGFLLPQILFNMFFNSEAKALSFCFYVGTTMVRILPHAYDLYRARNFTWYLDLSYIYANHRMDFYSTAWDIIIPCGGILFSILLYLQQRFGSRCILPKRFRESSAYEKVPVIGNDDL